jgi:AcrR family transcriptional regulator
MARPKPDPILLRKEVLAQASTIVEKEGYDALTMKYLADCLGMAVGKIYHYFPGKDAIFLELQIAFLEQLNLAIDEAIQGEKNDRQRMRLILFCIFNFAHKNIDIYRLVTQPPKKHKEFMDTPFEELARKELAEAVVTIETIRVVLATAMEDKLPPEELQKRFMFLFNSLHGLIITSNSSIFSYVSRSQVEFDNPEPTDNVDNIIEQQITMMMNTVFQ